MNDMANDLVIFEEKIERFKQQNEEAERLIVKGSDEHLDILLYVKKRLEPLTEDFSKLMADLIPSSNGLTAEQVQKAIPQLLDLYSSAIKLVATLKRSAFAGDLKVCAQNYYSQVENLREFIYDLQNFRCSDEDSLGKILEDINSF